MVKPIIVVAGPASCGKTSAAEAISQELRFTYLEGDDYHPPENIKKMSEGHALTDDDRWPWLERLREAAIKAAEDPEADGVVVTCSALKKKYRDVLNKAEQLEHVTVWYMFLIATAEELAHRIEMRQGHFMKKEMLQSQLDALELPKQGEEKSVQINVMGTKEENKQKIIAETKWILAESAKVSTSSADSGIVA
ncbi:thermoresistant gluconokinase [Saitoella complicata NRRL Y-17804]|uniref:Gluconokinase n=1 Tax=Saitoella complicata (strain BCRC 22490 / CBS 7301 / JCM 7358 / NBRC 10748 / NRRL Y-17804) TaxID=698492 RepID=A0A0E9NJ04_SAICN|nr:thermoresistant gluconokinase [Saitoella complicata NRRL Y-17804]ODQ56020.1 thermoresistant gluconokinase [Saitoella complicata NRRL Y-17804]GAO49365.1 hypothetical protein G7K_3516-t1 [Saitoella complicata NRRL Y-17804]